MKNAMKRLGLLLLLLSFLALPPAGAEEARDVLQEGDFRYLLRADGKAQIVGYTGEAESVAIPAALGGAPVAEVAAGAFFYAEELREVIIPEGVTTLQEMAFLDCPGLRRAVLPDSLAEVPGNPFPLCDGLEEVVLSPEHPLLRCTDGCLYAWPEKRLVALLRPWAYTEFAVPEGVETVGSFALYWAVNLERVSLPGSVTRIGSGAFDGCRALKELTLPAGLTELGENAFGGTGLVRMDLPAGITRVPAGLFRYCDDLEAVGLPDGITEIGDNAFDGCRSLGEIRLPEGLRRLGHWAFYGCGWLETLALPASLTEVADGAFALCHNLTLTLAEGNPALTLSEGFLLSPGDRRLIWCTDRRETPRVSVPEGTEIIGEDAFSGCLSLEEVSLPAGVREIRARAFCLCEGLRRVDVGPGLERVGEEAFSDCARLRAVVLPEGTRVLEDRAFRGCGALETVTLPASLTEIGEDVFDRREGFTLRLIPGSPAESWAREAGLPWSETVVNP